METRRYPLLAGACAVFLVTGCAQTGPQSGLQASRIEPVYRVQQPVGTAAGQYAIGRIDLSERRYEAAIKRFRAALRLDPTLVEAYNGLGVAYGQTGRFAEAAEAFRAALASGPAQAHLLNNLGFALLKAGQLDEAWESLRRSHDLDPGNVKTLENLALLAEARRLAAQRSLAPPVAAAATLSVAAPGPLSEHAPVAAKSSVAAEPVPAGLASAASTPAAIEQPAVASTAGSMADVASKSAAESAVAAARKVAIAPPTAMLIAVAQAEAAKLLGEAPNPRAYEIVVSRSSDTELVQLTPGVYELRSNAVAIAAPSASRSTSAPQVAVAPVRTYRIEARVATVPEQPAIRPLANVVPTAPKVLALPPLASLKTVAGLEVSNGVGLRSLAGRTARQLERFGASVARVSDYRTYGKGRTEIHYLAGHVAGAKALQQRLPVEAKLVEVSKMHPGVNVRLVVGRDMVAGPVAWWSEDPAVAESATMARAVQLAPPTIGRAPAMSNDVGEPLALAAPRGAELKPFAAKVARVDVEDGWRYL
jgi:tetratricopeptide (TPR) repeat protein